METIRKIIVEMKSTLKRINFVLEEVNIDDIKDSRRDYTRWYLELPRPENKYRVFIDEGHQIFIKREIVEDLHRALGPI